MNIGPFPLEVRMRSYFYIQNQITCGASLPSMALLRNTQINTTINTLWNIYSFSNLTMIRSFASASHTRTPDDLTKTITVSTHLLDHEGTLSDCLESLATTATADSWRCPWLSFCSLTCATNVCTRECHSFLSAIDGIHEIDLHVQHDVLPFCLCLTPRTWSILTSKHLLEFFKDVTEASRLLTLSELLRESLEAFKTLESTPSKWVVCPLEWVLSTERILCLLVSCHASLIINPPFVLITQGFIRVVNLGKFLFSLRGFVHIWMVLLGKLEVALFNIRLRCASIDSKSAVKVV